MIKILILLMLSFSVIAEDDDGRKMTPEELAEYNRQQIARTLYPDNYAVSQRIMLSRSEGQCYDDYVSLLVSLYSTCQFFKKYAQRSAGLVLNILADAQNVYSNGMAVVISQQDIPNIAMIKVADRENAQRDIYGNPTLGSPSIMTLSNDYLNREPYFQRRTISHELGHAFRAQNGIMSRNDGAWVSLDNVFYRPIGWCREEMENVGIIPSVHSFSTENAFLCEMNAPRIHSYGGMTASRFFQIEQFINEIQNPVGWHNVSGLFYVDFDR